MPASIDESLAAFETPAVLVARLSAEKAKAITKEKIQAYCSNQGIQWPEGILVLGADTVIDLDQRILGKPQDENDAVQMLTSLSNKTHKVVTGVSVCQFGAAVETITVVTEVQFGAVSKTAARAYWRTGEPSDKAGGYAIQGIGAQFISHLVGSYSNVVGLPLFETVQLLEKQGLRDHV